MAVINPQNTYVTNFNADGQESGVNLMTDERGHMFPISKLFEGEVLGGTMEVIPPSTPGMAVKVTSGYAHIKATSNHSDFCYLGWMETDLMLTLAAAAVSGARYSAIVAYIDTGIQYDESVTNNPGLMVIKEVTGQAGPSPAQLRPEDITADTDISNKPYIVLAQIYVPAGAQTIAAGNIIDKRDSISLRQGVALPEGSYASGVRPGPGSSTSNNIQISVINSNAQVPSSASSDLLVCRISQ